jgi:hypothetical protein
MKTLRDRCASALSELKRINRDMEQGTLNRAHIKRWDAQIDYLVDFVHAETGRKGDPKLDQTAPLVCYFGDESGREEMIAAFKMAWPNSTTRKMP